MNKIDIRILESRTADGCRHDVLFCNDCGTMMMAKAPKASWIPYPKLRKKYLDFLSPTTETVSDYKYKCDCVCHLVVPDELNNCDCTRFHNTPLSEHDLELIREGRAMSDRDTRRGE